MAQSYPTYLQSQLLIDLIFKVVVVVGELLAILSIGDHFYSTAAVQNVRRRVAKGPMAEILLHYIGLFLI